MRTMSRFLFYLALITCPAYTALVTETANFSDRIDKLYNKLDLIKQTPTTKSSLYEKIEQLNSLGVGPELSEDDEELVATIQMWGMLNPQELEHLLRDLRAAKREPDVDVEYDWNDEDLQDIDYAMDGIEDDEEDEETAGSNVRTVTATLADPSEYSTSAITPSAIIRTSTGYRQTVVSAVDPIAATNERPRILDDSSLTPMERATVRRAALTHMGTVVRAGKCQTPQPRWLSIKQLAPATNLVYMPPCVQLHRCAPDTGCCYNDSEMCAPVAGKYVPIPLYLHQADGNFTVARMLFFNHTSCACVSKATLQVTRKGNRNHLEREVKKDTSRRPGEDHTTKRVTQQQTSRRTMNEQSSSRTEDQALKIQEELTSKLPTQEPAFENDEQSSAPQLRRCTCPTLFHAKITSDSCACNCDWSDPYRRRDCLSLSRGREHFGLKDRVCVGTGDCSPPTCDYGAYEFSAGRCPHRWYKRIRLNGKRTMDRTV